MHRFYGILSRIYFFAATIALMIMALLLLFAALWNVARGLTSPERTDVILDAVGLLIIGFAVIETAKFVAEEEILRRRELRSALESRRSLTKFISIIVIAASLEALVMVFKASQTSIVESIYPAVLFAASSIALVALGAYQWLSSRIEPPSHEEALEAARSRDPNEAPTDRDSV